MTVEARQALKAMVAAHGMAAVLEALSRLAEVPGRRVLTDREIDWLKNKGVPLSVSPTALDVTDPMVFAVADVSAEPTTEVLAAFDEQFGVSKRDDKDGIPYSDGRRAGCDDCARNIELRDEHRKFVAEHVAPTVTVWDYVASPDLTLGEAGQLAASLAKPTRRDCAHTRWCSGSNASIRCNDCGTIWDRQGDGYVLRPEIDSTHRGTSGE